MKIITQLKPFNPTAVDIYIPEYINLETSNYRDFQWLFYHWMFWSMSPAYNSTVSCLHFYEAMDKMRGLPQTQNST